MFFNDWYAIWRIILIGFLSYFALLLVLRISGKRTLSKMNAFDLIVTIALGSTLATVILSKDVPLFEGITALTLLVLLQYIVTWSIMRFTFVSKIVKSEPALLYHKNEFLERTLKKERVLKEEILQAVRNQGIASLNDVGSVVLETDGSLSIIRPSENYGSSLNNVTG